MSTSSNEEEEYIMGIDEAGRGPVLGALVYGACLCKVSRTTDLANFGFAGETCISSIITHQQIEERKENKSKVVKLCDRQQRIGQRNASAINKGEYLHWIVDVIPPDWMSSRMLAKNRYSLNEISHGSAMNLIDRVLKHGFKLKECYLDTVGIPETYEQKLKNSFNGHNIKFTVSPKADSLFPIVSAASICAKVTRDYVLEHWVFSEKHITIRPVNRLNFKPKLDPERGISQPPKCANDHPTETPCEPQTNHAKQFFKKKYTTDSTMEEWLGNGYPSGGTWILTKFFLKTK
ncbi:ribonuclease H1 large subunit [Reticulomyxa filosa]|uniref:Ribonuclease n=1 Tax=Reticulomyxa filosa TaxID=46433 RepID=X6MFP2_RETFI|nr:ribonuclease H1 large subunit [Reticulomyxa filosa]|eukprot:ETO12828.1 ribonuclease H1 large subunit [Reticulomyxa filosa]